MLIGFIICIFIFILIRNSSSVIKGRFGEKIVTSILLTLPEDKYKILNDIMLKTDYGTTQIDHIVVSVYGIFVIETKNYKGWITGDEFSEYWTKNMYKRKYQFRNPLKQNYAHVMALKSILNLSENFFIPIVAFSGNADIKVNTRKPVVYINEIYQAISSYQQEKLRVDDLNRIVDNIYLKNIVSKGDRKQHVVDIQMKVRENNAKINSHICPRCGGNLVPRNGRYGYFIGCSNYPKCKYTVK